MPEQTPATTTATTTSASPATVTLTTPTPSPPVQPPAAEKQPPWGKPENFNADQAWELIQNLRSEKSGGGDTAALQNQIQQMQTSMEQQRNALATMLGVKPEETSDTEKLAEQINGLQKAVLDAEKRAISAATSVPESMLTATDAEGLRAQAQAFVEFAQAAHYAAATSTPAAPAPAFQANPGQGQGNTPPSPEALADAEYEKYFPATARQ